MKGNWLEKPTLRETRLAMVQLLPYDEKGEHQCGSLDGRMPLGKR
jgi:hypothetical protein